MGVCRCVRPDETSATVRCHYMSNGMVTFTFTIRRREFFMPAGVLLKCFMETTERELFRNLLAACPTVRLLTRHSSHGMLLWPAKQQQIPSAQVPCYACSMLRAIT